MNSFKSRSVTFAAVTFGAIGLLAACSSQGGDSGSSSEDLSADKSIVSLSSVQAAIKASGAKWVAGANPHSALPKSVRKQVLGVPLDKIQQDRVFIPSKDAKVIAAEGIQADAAATSLDWRNVSGKNYVSPIADQGRCGSCVAFATTGTFETQLNITNGDTTTPFELSPQYLFSCGGASCDEGWEVDDAVAFLKKTGETDDACMPYGSGPLGDDVACSKACSDHAKRAIKITGSTTPTSGGSNVSAVKAALAKGPLIATMDVYEDFEYYTSGVYKHVTGDMEGGHAVSIIGYNDADQAWICRNQWDTSWGENGFFEIAYTDVSGVGQETWQLDVTKKGSYLELANVHDYDVMSGTQNLTIDSAGGVTGVAWTLVSGTKTAASGTSADGKTVSIDTTKVADGVYTLRETGKVGTTTIYSERRTVYVLNGALTGSITPVSMKNGQTVSGESTFNVTVKSSPTPLTEMVWTVTDSTGKEVLMHSTQDPAATMQIFWGTTRFANGTYTLALTGYSGTKTLPVTSVSVVVKN